MDINNIWVFMFGSSTFVDESLHDIPNVESGINALKDLFQNPNYIGIIPSQICISLNKSREEIINSYKEFEEKVPKQAVLFIYYAGHGVLSDTGKEELFLTTPTSYIDRIDWSGIPILKFRDLINKSRVKRKIVILDCCFSARMFDGIATNDTQLIENKINTEFELEGTFLVASSGKTTSSKFDNTNPNIPMYFTQNLLEVIAEGIESENKFLDMSDVFTQVKRKCREKSLPIPYKVATKEASEIVISKNVLFRLNDLKKEDESNSLLLNEIKYLRSKVNTIEEIEYWQKCRSSNQVENYEGYLEIYTDGTYRKEAIEKLSILKEKKRNEFNIDNLMGEMTTSIIFLSLFFLLPFQIFYYPFKLIKYKKIIEKNTHNRFIKYKVNLMINMLRAIAVWIFTSVLLTMVAKDSRSNDTEAVIILVIIIAIVLISMVFNFIYYVTARFEMEHIGRKNELDITLYNLFFPNLKQ